MSLELILSKTTITIFGHDKRNFRTRTRKSIQDKDQIEMTHEHKYLGIDFFYSHGYFQSFSKRRIMDKYESFDEHLKERSNSWSHMLGTQSPFFKALMLPTFTYGIEIWEGDLTNSYWKVFKKSTKMHMMSHIKMRFSKFFFYYMSYFVS